jgi:hypothetical protein
MTKTLQPPSDPYEFQTYKILMQRGVPQAQAIEKAAFWAALKRTDPTGNTVVGPADNPLAKLDQPRIETDPITGRKEYKGTFQPQTYAQADISLTAGAATGSPPSVMEYSRNTWLGMRTPVDRFSLNPGADYYVEIPGPAPTMFAGGRDLPVITGSGVDPSVLRWVAWPVRHTAAFAESRVVVAQLIEISLEGDPEEYWGLASPEGRQQLESYFGRIATWVSTPVVPNAPLTEDDYRSFYPNEEAE